LPSANGARQIIAAILKNSVDDLDFTDYDGVSTDESVCAFSGTQVSFHSPVKLHIYDRDGNHAGPTENGDIEVKIPGAAYDEIEGNKFVFLPAGKAYRIIGEAEEAGSFNARVEKIQVGNYAETAYYNEVPLNSELTEARIVIDESGAANNLEIDKEGDGVYEDSINPDSILNEEERTDLAKPNTDINITGTEGKNGYYASDVKIDLAAEDDNSGVLKTEYSLDKGQSWTEYQSQFTLSLEGENKLIYSSIDRAGNREAEKEAIIRIDKTKPEILVLVPDEIGHDKKLDIEYLANDNISGVATDTIAVYLDDKPLSSDLTDLFYETIGEHAIKITAEDLAGNRTDEIININVITDIQGAISDVNRAYLEKMLNEKAKKELVKGLEKIEDYIEKYGKREEKRDKRQEDIMNRCVKKKGKTWCEKKLGKLFTKINYRLNIIHEKIVKLQYSLILKELELYRKKAWVTETGYGIIKEDLKYLISKL